VLGIVYGALYIGLLGSGWHSEDSHGLAAQASQSGFGGWLKLHKNPVFVLRRLLAIFPDHYPRHRDLLISVEGYSIQTTAKFKLRHTRLSGRWRRTGKARNIAPK
jgi:hypothetical protein